MKEILFPFSLLYLSGLWLDKNFTVPKKLPRPVISIGNLTWGGTGKTPLTIKTAKYLVSLGLKPCILTRGYGRRSKTAVIVSDGKNILSSPEECGDEPFLIAREAPGALVVVSSKRYSAAEMVLEKFPVDVFILDDGFQHWKMKRDLDIVCINALNPFGNGLLIPAGILREPKSSIRRAGLTVLTNCLPDAKPENLSDNLLKKFNIQAVKSSFTPLNFKGLYDNAEIGVSGFKGKNVVAFSAIAENSSFRKTLEEAGCRVLKHFCFRDHHWFSEKDLKNILANSAGADAIVTTSKDAARLGPVISKIEGNVPVKLYALNIELIFTEGEEVWQEKIRRTVRPS